MLKINEIFTEFDEEIYLGLDRDPLGFQMIWTHYGQKIFQNKTTSVANDIRNYTLNLIHHWVIRSLRDTTFYTALIKHEKNEKATIEKLVITLEMMVVYACFTMKWKNSKGILGIGNAQVRWNNQSSIDINLKAILDDKYSLLVRQISLGVNGRYKGPFMKMNFFDSDYSSTTKEYVFTWDKAVDELGKHPKIVALHDALIGTFSQHDLSKPLQFHKDKSWVENYTDLFENPIEWKNFAHVFWPSFLGFTSGQAQAIYDELTKMQCADSLKSSNFQSIFVQASSKLKNQEQNHIEHILTLEPILSKIDALFYLLLDQGQIDERSKKVWKNQDFSQFELLISEGPYRLKRLKKLLNNKNNLEKEIVDYHTSVMQERGLSPWMSYNNNGSVQIFIKRRTINRDALAERIRKPNDQTEWIHPYYLDSMKAIICGMMQEEK